MLFFALSCINPQCCSLRCAALNAQSTVLCTAQCINPQCCSLRSVHPIHNAVLCAPVHQSTMLFFALSASITMLFFARARRSVHQSTMLFFALSAHQSTMLFFACARRSVHHQSCTVLFSASIHNAVLCVCTALRASILMLFFARACASVKSILLTFLWRCAALRDQHSSCVTALLRVRGAPCINPQCCSLRCTALRYNQSCDNVVLCALRGAPMRRC
jgi:hypothetical protein